MHRGWIKLYRKISDNSLWLSEKFTRGQAWIDMVLLANHTDGFIRVRGHKIDLKRGQLGWSEVKLSERWQWSRGKTKRFINELESERQIVQQKSNITSMITIVNYDQYQSDSTPDDTASVTADGQQTDSKQDTNKNDKKDKNDKKEKKIPPPIKEDIGEFGQALSDFRDMRKSIKKPLTERAEEMIITKLEKLSDNESERIDILNQSTMSSYLGVFPLKRDFVKEEEKPIFREPTNFVGYGK